MFRREKEMWYICRMFKMENEHHLWSGPPLPDAELLACSDSQLLLSVHPATRNSFEHLSSVS